MSWSRAALALWGLLALAGCGWQPLYGQVSDGNGGMVGGNAGPQLASVHITPIANRVGQHLYNALRDRLNPGGAPSDPRYDLVIQISEQKTQMLVQTDQTATRVNLTLDATYMLYERGKTKAVFTGTSRATATYDLLNIDVGFATTQSTDDAHRRGAQLLADDIATQVAVFLAQPTGG